MKKLDSTGLKRLHREWRRRAEPDVALLLDSVQTVSYTHLTLPTICSV